MAAANYKQGREPAIVILRLGVIFNYIRSQKAGCGNESGGSVVVYRQNELENELGEPISEQIT